MPNVVKLRDKLCLFVGKRFTRSSSAGFMTSSYDQVLLIQTRPMENGKKLFNRHTLKQVQYWL